MSIQMIHFTIVDEHHALAFVRQNQQRYLVCVSFEGSSYSLSDIVHLEAEHCANCRQDVEENTPCLHFSFHDGDVQKLEETIEYYIKIHLLKNTLLPNYPFEQKKSKQAKENQQKVIALNLMAIHRHETIEAYGNTFDYYATQINGKRRYITIEQKERKTKPKQTTLLNKWWVEQFIANLSPSRNSLKELEQELLQKYDVRLTKWNKMTQLIEAIKKCILIYTNVYDQYKHPSFQELIIFLHEVLYREIPLRNQKGSDFLEQHEQMSSIIQLYIMDDISNQDCINQLVKEPFDYLPERKERVIFAIKALLKTKEVYQRLKELQVEETDYWHTDVCTMIILYIKIELGIMFKSKEEQKEHEDFLFAVFSRLEEGLLEEKQLYTEINQFIPFVHEDPCETINRYLQQISTQKPRHIFYMMEIEFQKNMMESLSRHEAYSGYEKIEVQACDLFQGEQQNLARWMTEEAIPTFQTLLKAFETEPHATKVWKVKNEPYPQMDEYILYNGDNLYRLHFRIEP